MKKTNYSYVIFFFILLIPTIVNANGGFFYNPLYSLGNIDSAVQQSLISYDWETQYEQMVLQTTTNKISASLTDMAWVIPFPTAPTVSQTADKEIFTNLNKQTYPKFYQKKSTQDEISCDGCNNNSDSGDYAPETLTTGTNPVTVITTYSLQNYEVEIVTSGSSTALTTWLSNNGYDVSTIANSVLASYISKNYVFACIKLTSLNSINYSSSSGGYKMPSLVFNFSTSKIYFPLRISSFSSQSNSQINLYIITNHRVKCSDAFSSTDINLDNVTSAYSYDYSSYYYSGYYSVSGSYLENLTNLSYSNNNHTFLVEYVKEITKQILYGWGFTWFPDVLNKSSVFYLTRMSTVINPNKMDADVFFENDIDDTFLPSKTFESFKVESSDISYIFVLLLLISLLKKKRKSL